MNKNIKLLLAAFLLIGLFSSSNKLTAQSEKMTSKVSKSMKGMEKEATPLIDRATFFGNPVIAGGQLSPNGRGK